MTCRETVLTATTFGARGVPLKGQWAGSLEGGFEEDEADHGDERGRGGIRICGRGDGLSATDDGTTYGRDPTLKTAKNYEMWRVSHPYHHGVAVRLICWFPPDENTAVVALFSGDIANMGDVSYDSVGPRATK